MNQLITSNQVTMSSREIAELTGKRHDHVMADINKMIEWLGDTCPDFSGELPDSYGRSQKVYFLPKRETLILVSGYNIDLRAKIIDCWQELENASKPAIPKTYAEALLEAGRLALENEKQAEQLRLAAPKVEFVDRFTKRETLQNATQVAQTMKMSAVKMNKHLDEFGGIYSKSVKRGRVFCQSWIDAGCGKMIQNDIGHPQAMFTTSGVARVTEIFISEGIV